MKHDVFISYSRQDSHVADTICRLLDAGGYSYWRESKNIHSGVNFVDKIVEAIEESSVYLPIISSSYCSSSFSHKELLFALNKHKAILPVSIDGAVPARYMYLLHNYQSICLDGLSESLLIKELYPSLDALLGRENKSLTNVAKIELESKIDNLKGYRPHQVDVDVFISYRRLDGQHFARNIMQGLKLSGYPKVFFDFHAVREGDFPTQIIDAIYSCKDFLLVLTPLALKNCAQPDDWVAKEIRAALKYGCKITPIVIENTFQDFPKDFPRDLWPIKNLQFHKILVDEYFEHTIEELSRKLKTVADPTAGGFDSVLQDEENQYKSSVENKVYYKVKVNRKARLYIDDVYCQDLEGGQLYKLERSPRGEFLRRIEDYNDLSIKQEAVIDLVRDKVDIVTLP